MDPEQLPSELVPLCAALRIAPCRPDADGWRSPELPAAPVWPLVPGAPPFDGVYRASWISPGVCVRLELTHAVVPSALPAALAARLAEQLGGDGAFYELGIRSSSQRDDRDAAILALALKIAAVG
jgi:hypothetical protein